MDKITINQTSKKILEYFNTICVNACISGGYAVYKAGVTNSYENIDIYVNSKKINILNLFSFLYSSVSSDKICVRNVFPEEQFNNTCQKCDVFKFRRIEIEQVQDIKRIFIISSFFPIYSFGSYYYYWPYCVLSPKNV